MTWPRPVPEIGDRTSSAERARNPRSWALPAEQRDSFYRLVAVRRDIRRFRADPVGEEVLARVLGAAHAAPSVGHSQPWRFVVVRDGATRDKACSLADRERLAQAARMDADAGRHLRDLDLEGIREAPVGVVVCCDRRAPAAGVLGRATFVDADVWSCVCAVENMWLAARAEGLGMGWVTLFRPGDLAGLVGAPDGVEPLGWFCLGWPDERPPAPGLERRGWSKKLPLESVVLRERWPSQGSPEPPASRLRAPAPEAVVAAHDDADRLMSPPGSLGVLDRSLDKAVALGRGGARRGVLVLAAADHPVASRGVSAYPKSVTRNVAQAALAGVSLGAVAARHAGLSLVVVDAGVEGGPLDAAVAARPSHERGDLVTADGLDAADVEALLAVGQRIGADAGRRGVVALGEVGVANTTVAAALGAILLGGEPARLVGLGAGADTAMLEAKRAVVRAVVARVGGAAVAEAGRDAPSLAPALLSPTGPPVLGPLRALGAAGGGEIAVLAGVVLGAARSGAVVVLDGMATSVAALAALRLEPAVSAHLVAGHRSREVGHGTVLEELGLEPLVDLRLRAGEGVGACLAATLLFAGLRIRSESARTG